MSTGKAFRVLGPFEALHDGTTVDLGGRKPAQLLALLVIQANEVVSTDRLVEDLWSGDAPRTARKSLQVHISRLRRELGDGVIETRPLGYVLRIDPREVDAVVFKELVDRACEHLTDDEPEASSRLLADALALWRGRALEGMDDIPTARAYAGRLEDLRLAAVELRLDSELALGRHTTVAGELERLVGEHPLREGFRRQLIIALYRSGRQADALNAYRDARRFLVTELGVEPGPELRGLESAVLRHDPALLVPPRSPRGVTARRWKGAAVLAVVVATVATAAAAVALRSDAASPEVVPNSLVRVDSSDNAISAVTRVGRDPDELAAGDGAVWVVNRRDRTVSRVAYSGGIDTIGGITFADHVAVQSNDVWVSSFDKASVARIDGDNGQVVETVGIPSKHAEGLTVGGGFLWITNPSPVRAEGVETVSRLDLQTHEVASTIRVGKTPIFAAFGYGGVWVSNYDDGTVSAITPGTTHARTIRVGRGPLGIATGYGSVWVVCYWDRLLVRIDPTTLKVVARMRIGAGPLGVAAGAGGVWVTNRDSRTVLRIDPGRNRVVATIRFPAPTSPTGVAVGGGAAWVTARRCDSPPCF